MLSAELVRDMFEGIVTSHEDGLTFHSLWNTPLDQDHDLDYPAGVVLWKEPEQGGVLEGRSILDRFTVQMAFVRQHDTERTTGERDAVHSDMSLVARQCFYRFHDLYVRNMTTFQGEDINIRLEGTYTLTPVWDQAGTSTTGVVLTFTFIDQDAYCISDSTFPLT